MAKTGDSYVVTLKKAHLEWGTHRYTHTRGRIYGEGYLPIPARRARAYEIYNSNNTGGYDVLGVNIFNCQSRDGFLNCEMKAQGCSTAGSVYAKQFSVDDDLRALGDWYAHIGAVEGDRVRVTWMSATDIVLEKI